jgi:predicted phage tail protein
MRTIQLHGELGEKFGAEWRLDIASPVEAIRGIAANRPELIPYFLEAGERGVGYRVIVGDEDRDESGLKDPCGQSEVIHIVPIIAGSKNGGIGIVLGAVLMIAAAIITDGAAIGGFSAMSAAGYGTAASIAGSLAWSVGMSLVLGGVASMLSGTPKDPSANGGGDGKQSYFWTGQATPQTASLGTAVPVGYGELIVPGIPVSSGMTAEAIS